MFEGYTIIYPKDEMPSITWKKHVAWIKNNCSSATLFIKPNKWYAHDYIWVCFSNSSDATLYKLTWIGN